jgi:phospholipid/cholesterol/gamma-HCH transport system substrate-binding protein
MALGRRARPQGISVVNAGLIALAVILAVTYLGFTKDIPFSRGFQVKAVFESANSIRPNSPVRIAGVNVGKVKKIEAQPGSDAAVITMEIKDDGLPIHADATAKIRPRIFLEGNFYVDLRPGTAAAPTLDDGDTIKVTQTATPVQLDEVLTALQSDTRQDLKDVLEGLGSGLSDKPSAEQDRQADRRARGQTAAESFNDAYRDIPASERSTAQVLDALLGSEPEDDLQRTLRGVARATEGLGRNEGQLKDLITNFNRTMAAFASEQVNLRTSIRELAPTLENANAALAALNDAFPPTRAFAREILPGVRETPATITASLPWIEQARRLVSRAELGGLARDLSPATRDLAKLVDEGAKLLPELDLASRCAYENVLPAGDIVVQDEFTSGVENYKEFFWTLVGLAGEGANTDGNGGYVRFHIGGGHQTMSFGSTTSNIGQLFGNNPATPLGSRPRFPGKPPPYRPNVPCHTQDLPDVNGSPTSQKGPAANKVTAAPAPTGTAADLPGPSLPQIGRPLPRFGGPR